MKTKTIGFSFLLLSIILVIFYFNFNHQSRQLEKKINSLNNDINFSNETNKVLLSEYSAHTNPKYLKKLISMYLDYKNINLNKTVVYSKNNFIDKINDYQFIIHTKADKISLQSENNKNN